MFFFLGGRGEGGEEGDFEGFSFLFCFVFCCVLRGEGMGVHEGVRPWMADVGFIVPGIVSEERTTIQKS